MTTQVTETDPFVGSETGPGAIPVGDIELVLRRLVDRAVVFAEREFGPGDIHEAWRAFRVWLSPWMDLDAEDWPLFLHWYVFHWRSPKAGEVPSRPRSIAERFARAEKASLAGSELQLLTIGSKDPPDFYEIMELREIGRYYVKSLLLGYQHSYAFSELPEGLGAGQIFFGKIIHLHSDRGVIVGHSRALPMTTKFSIAQMRVHLVNGRKKDFLRDFSLFEPDVLNLYHDIQQT